MNPNEQRTDDQPSRGGPLDTETDAGPEPRGRAGTGVDEPAQSATQPSGAVRAGGEAPGTPATAELDRLTAELEQAKAAAAEAKENYLRALAELENTRRRAENDVASARKFAVERFASELLAVHDSLDRAREVDLSSEDRGVLENMKEGLDLTLKQLDAAFEKFAIQPVVPQPGERLDPERHQAMTVQESADIPANHIVSVVQKGYMIHDRLLRAAMVIVAKAPVETTADTAGEA